MISGDIIDIMDTLAPPHLIEDWDNCGLQLGSRQKKVKRLLLALDINENVMNMAKAKRTDMIITHHPVIFDKIDNIISDNTKGRLIYDIIRENIVVFSAHSNLDQCQGGVNDALAEALGIENQTILSPTYEEKLYKLVVFVPIGHSDSVREAMTNARAGHIGNYSHCTYNLEGTGTFMPLEGTNPFIGKPMELERVDEARIETIVKEEQIKEVIKEMVKAHPYEEVAYDIYPLSNKGIVYGYGKVGTLAESPTLMSFSETIKQKLGCDTLRIYGDPQKEIKKVAVCGGSGGDFIMDAFNKGVDVYVTGDIKYHEAQLAKEIGLSLIDANHFNTEWIILPYLKKYLEGIGLNDVEIYISGHSSAPFVSI